jgi:SAM-dependent methyltransferase
MDEESSLNQEAPVLSVDQPPTSSGSLDQWLFQLISRFVQGKVLELGSGNGNISALFSVNGIALRISDPNEQKYELLRERFEVDPMIKRIHQIDLANERFSIEYERYIGRFDTIVSLNSSKFRFDDRPAWTNAKKLLRERGRLIILLPAPAALFEVSDESLGEWYRWTERHVSNLLGNEGEMIKIQGFVLSEIPRSPDIMETDALPYFLTSEESSFQQAGLFLVVVARKV